MSTTAPPAARTDHARPWLVLVVVCFGPVHGRARRDDRERRAALDPDRPRLLGDTSLHWVVNAYTLVFGGFLLLGGRAADLLGGARLFLAGVILFAGASLVNGLATSAEQLIVAPRAPGPRRRAALPRRPLDHHHLLRRGRRTAPRRSRLGGHRRGRRRRRPAARRHPHREPRLAVDLLRQRADRHRDSDPRRPALRARIPRPGGRSPRHFDLAGAVTVTGGLIAARLRDRRRPSELGLALGQDARPRRPRRSRCWPPSS